MVKLQVSEEFLDVLGVTLGVISVGGLFGIALGAQIEGHNVKVRGEFVDLQLEDIGRHGLARNHDDGWPGACVEVVQGDAIAGAEVFTLGVDGGAG